MKVLQGIIFASILLMSVSPGFAQPKAPAKAPVAAARPEDAPGVVWKKQIARYIDMGEKNDVSDRRISDVSSENTLIEMFVNLIKNNKILAYTNTDHNF